MRSKAILCFALIVTIIAITACVNINQNIDETVSTDNIEETTIAPKEEATLDSGPTIYSEKSEEIAVSEDAKELIITLEGNATTGYEWSFSLYGDKVLKKLSTEYIVNDHEDGMVGVGGRWVSKYKVVGDGKATILVDYQRSWEDAPIESKQITVIVSEGKIISVENMQLEIDPVEETFIEETTAN